MYSERGREILSKRGRVTGGREREWEINSRKKEEREKMKEKG